MPIEASVILLPIFEFIRTNSTFCAVLLDSVSENPDGRDKLDRLSPLSFNILTLSSYLFAHASSSASSSPRAIPYANLSMKILLAMVENSDILTVFCQPSPHTIRLCRQRPPFLPMSPPLRPPVGALLDSCVLWLRHNLRKRLEVSSYITSLSIAYRVIWFVNKKRIRLEYDWTEFWRALIGLLNFLSNKLESLATTGGVERLAREAILVLDLAISRADTFLPTPQSIHEFIYELVRSSPVLKKQVSLLQLLSLPAPQRRASWMTDQQPTIMLSRILSVTEFYEEKIAIAGAVSAKDAMDIVAREIEADGLHGVEPAQDMDQPPKHSEDVFGFARYACVDGLSLMP